jgi:hypothetical protein
VDRTTGGKGFEPWVLRCGKHSGFFAGSSTANFGDGDIDSAGKAWGIFAHSNETAAAYRRITAGPLGVSTQRFSFRFDHGKVKPGGPSVGVGFQNAASNNLWELFFAGGDAHYIINDGDGGRNSNIPFTSDGLRIVFRLTSADEYLVEIVVGSKTNRRTGRLIQQADQSVRLVHFWNYDAGDGAQHDAYFNNLLILAD